MESFHEFFTAVNEAKHNFLLKFVKHEAPNFVEVTCDLLEADNNIFQIKLEPETANDEIAPVEDDDDEHNSVYEVEVTELEFNKAADNGAQLIELLEVDDFSSDANDTGDEYDSKADLLGDSAACSMEQETFKNEENNSNATIKNQENCEIEQFDHMFSDYVGPQCEMCKHPFETLREAIIHYRSTHKQTAVTVKCCQRRVKIYGEYLYDHIRYHLNPNEFQ